MAQYNRLMSDTWIIDELKKLNRKIDANATKGTGTIIVADPETGVETIIGTLPDGSTGLEQFVGDTTPPPIATAPYVSVQPGQFVVTWDGLFSGAAEKPRDFVHVNVIGHKMNGATTLLSAPVGVIRLVTESVLVTLDVAGSGEYWQFSLESEDYNGNKAAESARSASFMMLDAISPVSEAWTDLNAEVLLATNTSASAQSAAGTAQDAADAAKAAADKALESSSKTYRRSGKDATGIVISSSLTPTSMTSVASDGAPGGFALQKTGTASGNVYDMSGMQDFNPDLLYRVTFKVRVVADATPTPKTIYAGILGLKADGVAGVTVTGTNAWTNAHYFAASNAGITSADGWKTYTGYFKGHAASGNGGLHPNPLDPGTVHTDVRKIVPLAFLDYLAGNGTWQVGSIELDVITSEAQKALSDAAAAQLKADQAFNSAEQAAEAAGDAQLAADGKAKTWYTPTEPAGIGHSVGDMWFDPNNNHRLSTWDGSNWITAQDAWLAQEIAESKGRTYTQTVAPPVEARLPQNLWIDTSLGTNLSVTKFWDATAAAGAGAWVPVKDQEINAAELRAAQDAKAKADAAAIAAINAQAYSKNASFDDWPTALPALYLSFGTGPTKETSIFLTGPNAARFNCTDATTDRGLNFNGILDHAANLEYFTVEVSFYLASGTSLNGAGVLLDWNGLTPNREVLSLSNEIPAPIVGKWYTISKTLRRPPTATGTFTVMDGYLMANYSGTGSFNGKAIKDIIFDWINIRPATAGEILAYNAPTTQYVDQAETDAIASAALTAQTKADAARDAAIADTTTKMLGKNKVVWSIDPATGTAGYIAGDTWFQRNASFEVIGQWEFTTSWQSRKVGEAVLGGLSAGKIISGFIDSARIEAGSIAVTKLAVGDFENLAPDLVEGNWSLGAAASMDAATTPFEDTTMFTFSNPSVYTSVAMPLSTKAKVSGGDQLAWKLRYKKAGDATGSGTVSMRLLFEKADGTLLQRLYLPSYSAAAPTGTVVSGTATVYAGSASVRIELVVSGGTGTVTPAYVGDIKLRRMATGELIVDGALDAKTITGPTIQTEATASRGIKLTPTEFMGFDGTTGNKSFSLTTGGTLSLKGEIKSGSTITGATLVGTEGIQTTPNTNRGVKMDSLGIKAWDGAGALTFSVNASTGEVEAPGIKANSIKGDKIESGSITTEKMRIGDFTNLVTNGYGDLGAGIGFGGNLIYETTDKPSSVTGVFKTTAGQGTYGPPAVLFDVDPSTEYLTEIWLKASLPNSRIYIELRDQVGVHATANSLLPAGTSQGIYALQNYIVPTVWTKFEVVSTTTATATKMRIGSIYFNHSNGSERNAVVSIAFSVRRRAQGTLLVDGSIKTNHMASGTIDAGVLVAGSITGTEIQSKAIGTDKLIISSTDNLILEADFGNNGSSWEMGTYKSIDATAGRGSTKALKITGTATAVTLKNMGNKIPISADARFRGAMWVKSSIATTANAFKIVGRFWTSNIAYTDIDIAASPALTANTWTKVEGMVPATIPSTAWAAEFYIRIANTSTTQITHVDFVSVTRAADGKLIVDGAITADKLETQLVLSTEVIAGNPALTHAKMNQSGFHVFAAQPDGSSPKEVISMGTSSDDYFGITDATGASVASISSTGAMTATSLNVDKYDATNDIGGLSIGGTQLEQTIDEKGGQLMGWASRATDGLYYAGTTMHPYLSLQVDGLRAGRAYMVSTSPIHVTSDSANSDAIVKMHYLVGVDRAATITDPVISEANSIPAGWSTGLRQPITFNRLLTPSVDGSASLLLSYGVTSTGRAKITTAGVKPVILTVTDMGWAVPETGEIRNGTANAPASGSTGGETTPPASKKNYDVTWNATGLRSFEGNSPYNTYSFNTSYMYSGLSPAGYGDLSSMAIFPNLTTTLSGATVTGVWVYVYYDFWYYGSGGSAYIGLHGQTALTSTRPSKTYSHAVSANWPRASGRWIKMSSSTYDGWRTGTHRGFTLGSSGGGYERYGYAHNPRLRITWTR